MAAAAAAGGLAGGCGVKGPLYLPEEPQGEKKKDEDKGKDKDKGDENVSRRSTPPDSRGPV